MSLVKATAKLSHRA